MNLPTNAPAITAPRPRLLFLTHRLPWPADRGDRIRSHHLLKHLAPRFHVSLACTVQEPVEPDHVTQLWSLTEQIAIQPISNIGGLARGSLSMLRGRSVTEAYHRHPTLVRTVRQWHRQQPFDIVLTYCTSMLSVARPLVAPGRTHLSAEVTRPRHVLDLVDVDSLKWQGYAATARAPMRNLYQCESRRLRRVEAGDLDTIDALLITSEAEALAYNTHVQSSLPLYVIRNGVDLDTFVPLPPSGQPFVTFVGVLNYRPNVEGVQWFVRDIWPGIHREIPRAQFRIVGRDPSPAVQQLDDACDGSVKVIGPVPDVRPELAQASVVVAPLLLARGVQNKVLEAMASARAVVCTSAAANGVNALDEQHLCIADKPDDWVARVTELLNSPARCAKLGEAARNHVEHIYRWDRCLDPLEGILRGAMT